MESYGYLHFKNLKLFLKMRIPSSSRNTLPFSRYQLPVRRPQPRVQSPPRPRRSRRPESRYLSPEPERRRLRAAVGCLRYHRSWTHLANHIGPNRRHIRSNMYIQSECINTNIRPITAVLPPDIG